MTVSNVDRFAPMIIVCCIGFDSSQLLFGLRQVCLSTYTYIKPTLWGQEQMSSFLPINECLMKHFKGTINFKTPNDCKVLYFI